MNFSDFCGFFGIWKFPIFATCAFSNVIYEYKCKISSRTMGPQFLGAPGPCLLAPNLAPLIRLPILALYKLFLDLDLDFRCGLNLALFFGLGFVETIPSPRLGILRGVFLANHLASTDNLTRTIKRQNTYHLKLTIHKSVPNKQQHNEKLH